MNKFTAQVSTRLTFALRAGFSRSITDYSTFQIKDRVMSTPTWPVPYYQRLHRAYPVRCIFVLNLTQRKRQLTWALLIEYSMIQTGTMLRKHLNKLLKADNLFNLQKITSDSTVRYNLYIFRLLSAEKWLWDYEPILCSWYQPVFRSC